MAPVEAAAVGAREAALAEADFHHFYPSGVLSEEL
jgi:hypothetical protein